MSRTTPQKVVAETRSAYESYGAIGAAKRLGITTAAVYRRLKRVTGPSVLKRPRRLPAHRPAERQAILKGLQARGEPEAAVALWLQYDLDRTNTNLRRQLADCYLSVVRMITGAIASRLPGSITADELIGAGTGGLLQAIEKFELTRGVKFTTYCVPRIRGAVLDELREIDFVPRLARSRSEWLKTLEHELSQEDGPVTEDELFAQSGLSRPDFYRARRLTQLCSLNHVPGGHAQNGAKNSSDNGYENAQPLQDLLPGNGPCPWQQLQRRDFITKILRGCNDEERVILFLYYFKSKTMKFIGEALDLSESRVSQMHSHVIARLNERLSPEEAFGLIA